MAGSEITYSPGRVSVTVVVAPMASASDVTSRPGAAEKRVSSAVAPRHELGRRPARHETTVVDDADAVAQLLGFVHRVRGEHHGDPAVAQLLHQRPRGRAGVRVHPRGRLVEEQQRRTTDRAPARARAVAVDRPTCVAPACRARRRARPRRAGARGRRDRRSTTRTAAAPRADGSPGRAHPPGASRRPGRGAGRRRATDRARARARRRRRRGDSPRGSRRWWSCPHRSARAARTPHRRRSRARSRRRRGSAP